MSVKPSQFDLIAKLLDATTLRQRIVAQNIANVNTPGYQRHEVKFEEQLSRLLDDSSKVDQLKDAKMEVLRTEGLPDHADGNNVDIDMEVGQMNHNAILFSTYSQILATKMGMMRSAINGQP